MGIGVLYLLKKLLYMSEKNKNSFKEGRDFYLDKGKIILTESYLLKKGKCCGLDCKFCPYSPKSQKDNTIIRKGLGK